MAFPQACKAKTGEEVPGPCYAAVTSMPTASRTALLTARDLDILSALDHCPLTALQLLTLSQTFVRPFTGERRVRERLQVLCTAGRTRRWQYATAGTGAPGYYTLTPLGYELLH